MNNKYIKDLKRRFPTFGMIIITFLGLFGFFAFMATGILSPDYSLKEVLLNDTIKLVYSVFFMGTSLFCWYLYILNIFLPPTTETMFLTIVDNEKYFIARNGKKYECITEIEAQENKYYKVLRTHNYALEVISESYEEFEIKEYESYWLNMYLPDGDKIEDLLLLPIAYVMSIPGLVFFIIGENAIHRSLGLLFFVVPFSIILNDLFIKIQMRNGRYDDLNEDVFKKSDIIFESVIFIAAILLLNTIRSNVPFEPIRELMIPIIILLIFFMLNKSIDLFKNEKITNIYNRLSPIMFIGVFLAESTIIFKYIPREDGDLTPYYVLALFYIVGIIVIIYELFSKKKKK